MAGVWRSIVNAVSRAVTVPGTGGLQAEQQASAQRQQQLATSLQDQLAEAQAAAPEPEPPTPLPDPYAPIFGGTKRQGRSSTILSGRSARTLAQGIGSTMLSRGGGGASSGSARSITSGTYSSAKLG